MEKMRNLSLQKIRTPLRLGLLLPCPLYDCSYFGSKIFDTGIAFAVLVKQTRKRKILTIKLRAMTLIGFLVLLVVAAVCGAIGQSLAGYDLGGCLVSIVVGFIGAYLGMWLAGKFGLPEVFTVHIQGKSFPILWAIIGSAVFTLIMALLRSAFTGRRL